MWILIVNKTFNRRHFAVIGESKRKLSNTYSLSEKLFIFKEKTMARPKIRQVPENVNDIGAGPFKKKVTTLRYWRGICESKNWKIHLSFEVSSVSIFLKRRTRENTKSRLERRK